MTGVTCRYWGGARAAAGVESERVEARTLAEVLAAITALRPGDTGFARVIGACSVLVDGIAVGSRPAADVVLTPGETVEFLPPFAGG